MATKTSTFTELVADAQKQTLSSVKQAQDLFVRATELAVGAVPESPALGVLRELPWPRVAVEASFDFAGEILKLQKDFAMRLGDTIAEQAHQPAKG